MIRRSLLTGFAALALVASAGAAAADTFGKPGFGFPVTNQNIGTVTNTAAGIGNTAQQKVLGLQGGLGSYHHPGYKGHSFGALTNQNLGSATNLAAGVGNVAQQKVIAQQFGAPGALFNSNIGTVANTAAGVGNLAQQEVIGIQD